LWALPKGTPDQGETLEETAVREVKEETGLCVEIEATLGNIEYWFARASERVHKKVYFYLMGERGGSFDDHDLEFDVIQWIVAGQALQTLTYPTEREVVRRALETLGSRAADAE
jgi:8-oxo-dGTP pyrophosphatase MutT (NUDIX family)